MIGLGERERETLSLSYPQAFLSLIAFSRRIRRRRVRHRLELFFKRLCLLRERFGEPESVAVEFVREDFMGAEARSEYRAAPRRTIKNVVLHSGQTTCSSAGLPAAKRRSMRGSKSPDLAASRKISRCSAGL